MSCLFVRTLPIHFALLGQKRKYIKSKTTAKLIEKRTSIGAVRDKMGQIDTFLTPLLSGCRLPLKRSWRGRKIGKSKGTDAWIEHNYQRYFSGSGKLASFSDILLLYCRNVDLLKETVQPDSNSMKVVPLCTPGSAHQLPNVKFNFLIQYKFLIGL